VQLAFNNLYHDAKKLCIHKQSKLFGRRKRTEAVVQRAELTPAPSPQKYKHVLGTKETWKSTQITSETSAKSSSCNLGSVGLKVQNLGFGEVDF